MYVKPLTYEFQNVISNQYIQFTSSHMSNFVYFPLNIFFDNFHFGKDVVIRKCDSRKVDKKIIYQACTYISVPPTNFARMITAKCNILKFTHLFPISSSLYAFVNWL